MYNSIRDNVVLLYIQGFKTCARPCIERFHHHDFSNQIFLHILLGALGGSKHTESGLATLT